MKGKGETVGVSGKSRGRLPPAPCAPSTHEVPYMANHFTKASFMLAGTPAEAEALRLIAEAVDILGEAGT